MTLVFWTISYAFYLHVRIVTFFFCSFINVANYISRFVWLHHPWIPDTHTHAHTPHAFHPSIHITCIHIILEFPRYTSTHNTHMHISYFILYSWDKHTHISRKPFRYIIKTYITYVSHSINLYISLTLIPHCLYYYRL